MEVFAAVVMSVVEALERDLTAWAKLNPSVAESTLAAVAFSLAVKLDDPTPSAAMKSMVANSLVAVLTDLRAQLPQDEEKDAIDDLARRRAERIARRSTAEV